MHQARTVLLLVPALMVACSGDPDKQTLTTLHAVEPDLQDVRVEDGLDQAISGYKTFLDEAPTSALTPEAMRRLADLNIEKEYGLLGGEDRAEMPAPTAGAARARAESPSTAAAAPAPTASSDGTDEELERRAESEHRIEAADEDFSVEHPDGQEVASNGPAEAIELYDRILETYPNYHHNDKVLYQKARAFEELGRVDQAITVIDELIARYPHSRYIDEVQFRRAEYFFTRRKFFDAEQAYAAVVSFGSVSTFYELSLYKLGWTFYKQAMYEEALDNYVELLDHKVSIGYDFDQSEDESDERRIADTYRVISLSFSNIGGPASVDAFFAEKGPRIYEDRVYSNLGEFYLEKLRYNDAASSYRAFVALHRWHRSAPSFGIRIVEIYEAGGFPKLVLESKKDFAARYGLESEYWSHFAVEDRADVVDYLKGNLEDLANHYHAHYQDDGRADEKAQNFAEAQHWYRAYLTSFPSEPETPPIHYQLADLLLENRDFGQAAREYEHTSYDYPAHEQSSAAGYAAIYAHRQNEDANEAEAREAARRDAVTSTLRFVDVFPEHEYAAVVLGAAVDDLYDMKEYDLAIQNGLRLIEGYPEASAPIRRSAWAAVAHSYFDTARYHDSESAYAEVLALTPEEDETRADVVDNLAAAIYKQAEEARLAEDHRTAANHFLRVKEVTPTSTIRPAAEYDAAAALIQLEDWTAAASVLEDFRDSHPDNELHEEATKKIAFVYRESGDLSRAADEYVRVAREADSAELRAEALLVAGNLYEDSELLDRALVVYLDYVEEFPTPLERAVETRFKIAELYAATDQQTKRTQQLKKIVSIDRGAGQERTDRIRFLAARSSLVLTEGLYADFTAIELVQPFERSLKKKQRSMDVALAEFGKLLDYEVGEVTAAATFYMAEIYFAFSQALLDSERPGNLDPGEMLDYETVLEEEAFPFEERAIDVHEQNLELMDAGVFNSWVEKSLYKLAELMPGRYAKFEVSSGLIASPDRYAYRAPSIPTPEVPVAETLPSETAASEPAEAPAEPTAEVLEESPAEMPAAIDESAEISDAPAGESPIADTAAR